MGSVAQSMKKNNLRRDGDGRCEAPSRRTSLVVQTMNKISKQREEDVSALTTLFKNNSVQFSSIWLGLNRLGSMRNNSAPLRLVTISSTELDLCETDDRLNFGSSSRHDPNHLKRLEDLS